MVIVFFGRCVWWLVGGYFLCGGFSFDLSWVVSACRFGFVIVWWLCIVIDLLFGACMFGFWFVACFVLLGFGFLGFGDFLGLHVLDETIVCCWIVL